jgi:hypothetical protein
VPYTPIITLTDLNNAVKLGSTGSPHLVVGTREKSFRHSSLGAAVCSFGSSYTRKLAESRA